MKYLFFFYLLIPNLLGANIYLPSIFGDDMVLQQKEEVNLWGWGSPLENVVIKASWSDVIYKDTVDHLGKWQVKIKTPTYGGPYTIDISGYNNITLKNIMIGEVWLVSGQSNMQWSVINGIDNGEEEAKLANYPNIRLFTVKNKSSATVQDDVHGKWEICTPESMRAFSAVGYYFARRLQSEINVPIGIINSSWGGTPAEAWTPKEAIESDRVLLKNVIEKKQEPWGPKDAGLIYNAMISPITNFKIKGSLWYQGESNVSHADDYDRLLSTLVGSWRKNWGYEFPFYYVQIAPYKYGGDGGVRLRESQRKAESIIPNSAMIVISDIGNISDIHPTNKKDVGIRLANIALTKQYQIKGLNISGPSLKDYEIKGNKIILNFNTVGPLICNDACKDAFEISDYKNIQKSKITINRSSIILESDKIKFPTQARFNWCNTCEALLTDDTKLPCSSFKTD